MKRTYVRPTMVGERFVANEYVAPRIKCISLRVMHQEECYIIIRSLMERLMEYTQEPVGLNI